MDGPSTMPGSASGYSLDRRPIFIILSGLSTLPSNEFPFSNLSTTSLPEMTSLQYVKLPSNVGESASRMKNGPSAEFMSFPRDMNSEPCVVSGRIDLGRNRHPRFASGATAPAYAMMTYEHSIVGLAWCLLSLAQCTPSASALGEGELRGRLAAFLNNCTRYNYGKWCPG